MAEAQKKEAEAEVEAEAKPGKKKMIIIIAIVVVLAIAAGIGLTIFLLSDDTAVENDSGEPAPVARLPAIYLDLKPPIVVTYSHKGKQRFIQASLSVMARDQKVLDALELHTPVIRNRLINVYGGKDFEWLQTNEGRMGLLDETKSTINTILQEQKVEGEIEAVLFQNLVLQ